MPVSSFVRAVRLQHSLKADDFRCLEAMRSASSRFLPFFKGRLPLTDDDGPSPRFLNWNGVRALNPDADRESVFLRLLDGGEAALFATPVRAAEEPQGGASYADLRLAMLFCPAEAASIMSQGYSLLGWHRSARFCSRCGSGLAKNASGSRRTCVGCDAHHHHPPTSPVGIGLVVAPDRGRVLLVRQPSFPPGMYSCVAGFVDVGETLFQCIRREVAEEAGVEVDDAGGCELLTSQHWPFPSGSLMMGCTVVADDSQVPEVDNQEVEDAKWFAADDVKIAMEAVDRYPQLNSRAGVTSTPPKGTVAHQMLRMWLSNHHQ